MIKNKRDIDWLEQFSSETNGNLRTLFCYCHFDTDFIFSTNSYRSHNDLKYIASNSRPKKLPN